jgi:phosphoribosylamine---glycine ligase
VKVLVLGGGGREHALCWALDRAESVTQVHCVPGNGGISDVAVLHEGDPENAEDVGTLAGELGVDLVVVGPEAPLVAGVADALHDARIPVFGPTAEGARIEGSKAFAKDVMESAEVPTAAYWTGEDPGEAKEALARFAPPYVVKADGLAAGKGVRICAALAEAEEAVDEALVARAFGDAGARLVIEEFLHGPEVSLFGLCDGNTVVPLVPAQDFKRALDGDEGRNTGGMGAYSPVPAFDDELVKEVTETILRPTLSELRRRGVRFVGVLYAGLVLTAAGPRVLEFNARFGDPETQVVLPRLRTDLGELLLACATGQLGSFGPLAWDDRACVTVVLASGGYPGPYERGRQIHGLEAAGRVTGAAVFHAGTRREGDRVVTAGGRVLAVSGLGATIAEARATAYAAADEITFEGLHRRSDIAAAPTGA